MTRCIREPSGNTPAVGFNADGGWCGCGDGPCAEESMEPRHQAESRDPFWLPWRELTWTERSQLVFCWIIATAFSLAVFVGGILVLGGMADGITRYKSERNACLQRATNGLEIEIEHCR